MNIKKAIKIKGERESRQLAGSGAAVPHGGRGKREGGTKERSRPRRCAARSESSPLCPSGTSPRRAAHRPALPIRCAPRRDPKGRRGGTRGRLLRPPLRSSPWGCRALCGVRTERGRPVLSGGAQLRNSCAKRVRGPNPPPSSPPAPPAGRTAAGPGCTQAAEGGGGRGEATGRGEP